MAKKSKHTFERGYFKEEIHRALYNSEEVRELLLGDTSGMSHAEMHEEFKEHVKSHLFIDDTITDSGSYIFYDIILPSLEPNLKNCRVIMYLICHRDTLDDYYKEGYYGNKSDILSQMVENAIINNKDVVNKFGIGDLTLDSVDIYNSTHYYGCIMTFNVPNFR